MAIRASEYLIEKSGADFNLPPEEIKAKYPELKYFVQKMIDEIIPAHV